MFILTDTQQVTLTIQPTTRAGNPAPVDGAPVWSSSDENICTVQPAADGLSALVVTTGKLGTCQINVTADADLGEGVQNITGLLDIEVRAGAATSLTINAGTPEERP